MALRTDDAVRPPRFFEEIARQRQEAQDRQRETEAAKAANGAGRIGENNLFGTLRKEMIERSNPPVAAPTTEPKPPPMFETITETVKETLGIKPTEPKPLTAALTPFEATERIREIPVPDPRYNVAHDDYIKQTQQIAQDSLAAAKPPQRADYNGLPPQLANLEYQDSLQAYNRTTAELRPYADGISYVRYDQTVDYMFGEMKGNLNSPEFKFIKDNLDLAAKPPLFSGENASIGFLTAALTKFAVQVRSNGPWDHKPILKDSLGLVTSSERGLPLDSGFPVRGDVRHEVNYDIWSNVHYGYVGRAAGFDEWTLQTGAAAKIPGLTGGNDPVDVVTVQIGIDLWNKYGADMTQQQFESEVRTRIPEMIAAQQTQEYKDINGDFQHVRDINQTNRR